MPMIFSRSGQIAMLDYDGQVQQVSTAESSPTVVATSNLKAEVSGQPWKPTTEPIASLVFPS